MQTWDHSSHEKFYEYYADASQREEAFVRFRSIRDCVLKVIRKVRSENHPLEVADVGCGAGTQSIIWAEAGHHVHGLDVNGPLLELAKDRATNAGYAIDFRVGSASELPWPTESMDVCLAIELLEHVEQWQYCLNEFTRILRPGGVLFLTTTNKLCPVQQEFNLPLYSWYPTSLKRYYEHLAVTTRPEVANFAKYPAVNWFSFYYLRTQLSARGCDNCLDRFDVMDLSRKNAVQRAAVRLVCAVPLLRWLAHVATQGTMITAVKNRN